MISEKRFFALYAAPLIVLIGLQVILASYWHLDWWGGPGLGLWVPLLQEYAYAKTWASAGGPLILPNEFRAMTPLFGVFAVACVLYVWYAVGVLRRFEHWGFRLVALTVFLMVPLLGIVMVLNERIPLKHEGDGHDGELAVSTD